MEALKQSAEPLAQLKDIHLPEQVHNYPLAYGWWLLLACIVIAIVFVILKWRKRRQLCKAQKLALAQLSLINSNSNSDNSDEIVTLLKWAAFQYFPRNEIASLHGQALQDFLQQKLATKYQEKFQQLCGQQLINKYQAVEDNVTDNNLKQAAQLWLSQALPPKALPPKTASQEKAIQQEKPAPQGAVS